MACLWQLLEETEKGHPLDVFTGLLKFKT